MDPDESLIDDGRVSILGRSSPEGYELEIIDPVQMMRQVVKISWDDYEDDDDTQEVVEALIQPFILTMTRSEQPFIIEYDCGGAECYGAHVMTDEDWQIVENEDRRANE